MRTIFIASLLLILSSTLSAQRITRVNVATDGTQANLPSNPGISISANNRFIAFRSAATNLVPSDVNGKVDIFVHDRILGETSLVSVTSNGEQGSGESLGPTLSGDGRYVSFVSWSPDLVPGDNNESPDVFVHDRLTGETTLVSKAADGSFGNDWSEVQAISADGNFIAFVSDSTNLVAGDTNSTADVFLHHRVTGITTRVSVASDGSQGLAPVGRDAPAISETGRYVAFPSWSTWVSGDTNSAADIFVHDRVTGQTTLVSISTDGEISNDSSYSPSISDNGRFVAFGSSATNLVPDDTNDLSDAFVHDRSTGETTRISVAGNGDEGNGPCYSAILAADGRFVAFASRATNLVPNDNNNEPDVFLHDRATGQTARINVSQVGQEADDESFGPDISDFGLYVVFNSPATNLVPGDTNNMQDVFLVELSFADGFESGDTSAWSSTVCPGCPIANFSWSSSGLTVTFLNSSTGNPPLAYLWDFGDGSTPPYLFDRDPTHTFAAPGTYNVMLTVSNALGSDSVMKSVTVSQ